MLTLNKKPPAFFSKAGGFFETISLEGVLSGVLLPR
jgi:hypothetical protein